MALQEGKGLVEEKHYARTDIHKRLEELELSWQALIAATAEKKDRLQDAYQAMLFNRYIQYYSVMSLFTLTNKCVPDKIDMYLL